VRKHRYYVYILARRSRTLYTGVTGHIERRMQQHRDGTREGFSKGYRCDRLVHLEQYPEVQAAIACETEIKSWTRATKLALIQSDNPTWEDLSPKWGVNQLHRINGLNFN